MLILYDSVYWGKQISEPIENFFEEAKQMQDYGNELVLVAQDTVLMEPIFMEKKRFPN